MSRREVTDGSLEALVADTLAQGKRAAREGSTSLAYSCFRRVNQLDRTNQEAWLWRAGVTDDHAESKACLEELLSLNPSHVRAMEGLQWLREQYPSLFTSREGEPGLQVEIQAEGAAESSTTPVPAASSLPATSEAAVTAPYLPTVPSTPTLARPAPRSAVPQTLLRCPRCGKKNFSEEEVCLRCGTPLDARKGDGASTNMPVLRATARSHTLRTVLLVLVAVAAVGLGAVLFYTGRMPWV